MAFSIYNEETKMAYSLKGDGAVITEYRGDDPHVVIPDVIDNKPVVGIGAYAFSGKCMNYLSLPSSLLTIDHHGFSECRRLTHVAFPPKLKSIGNYAFYNCLELKSIHLCAYVKNIGFGAFMNCEKLSKLVQEKIEGQELSLGSLLDELQQQIQVDMHHMHEDGTYDIARLTFTEFVSEVIADAASIASICKQFIIENTGSGRNMRFAVGINGIDYRKYDSVFIKTVFMDPFDINIRIAIDRLMYPYSLGIDARTRYTEYIAAHTGEAAIKFVKEDDMASLRTLAELKLMTKEDVDEAMLLAAGLNRPEFSAFLMAYKHRNFQAQADNFSLEDDEFAL